MSDLIIAMGLLHKVFDEHAKGDGKLNKQELTKLLSAEFGLEAGDKDTNETMDKMFKDLDADGSGFVEFAEYVTFVAALAVCLGK